MSLLVSRVLHAGYIFEYAETKIIFDPIFENPFSRNCFAYPKVNFNIAEIKKIKFDAVFISHYHDDHCSLESLNLIERDTPLYLYSQIEDLFRLIKEMGFTKVYLLQLNDEVKIGEIAVVPRPALNPEVDTIFEIRAGETKILNVVDAWIDPLALKKLISMAPWDLVLWPFQTMLEIAVLSPRRFSQYKPELPSEWLEQLKQLQPKNIIPSSCQFIHEDWSWYNQMMFPISYQFFAEQIKTALPSTNVFRLDPSLTIKIEKQTVEFVGHLSWISKTETQAVDYNYHPPTIFPQTADIAKKFSILNNEQVQIVLSYCKYEIVRILNEIGFPDDLYFRKPRFWRLSIFNHVGEANHFYYKIEEQNIMLIDNADYLISWTTEVPMTKLYQAISAGETTTSMYIRINDNFFDEKTELELKKADLLSDPLVHALSYQSEINYQKDQLKRIKLYNSFKT